MTQHCIQAYIQSLTCSYILVIIYILVYSIPCLAKRKETFVMLKSKCIDLHICLLLLEFV